MLAGFISIYENQRHGEEKNKAADKQHREKTKEVE
jgi:hypothetical protein